MADIFQWWVNLWNPIAEPTADLAEEAKRKYEAGEIDLATYLSTLETDQRLKSGIEDAQADYEQYAAENPITVGSVLSPVTDQVKNLMAVVLVAGALYLLIQWKRLEA